MTPPAQLSFADYLAITALKARYFRAVDTHRWADLRQVFTPETRFGGFGFGIRTGVESLIETLSTQLAQVDSQHRGFNPDLVAIAPGTVRGIWAMADTLSWAPDAPPLSDPTLPGMCRIEGRGFYQDEYGKTPNGWRITSTRLLRTRVTAYSDTTSRVLDIPARELDPGWLDRRAG